MYKDYPFRKPSRGHHKQYSEVALNPLPYNM